MHRMTANSPPSAVDDHRLNVLFVGGYDSTNFAYVELFRELTARGHTCRLVVENERDLVNNKMFVHADIPMVPLSGFSFAELDAVDIVICGPFVRRGIKALFEAVYARGKFLVSFANLFSSVTMWSAPDLLIASSEGKFDEFSRSGLRYNMVAVGNPQYDPLIRARQARPRIELDQVRNVLVVDQGAYPLGETGKRQLASTLVSIAVNNPQMTLHVKPRYLPDEAGEHLHSVSDHLYSYLEDAPQNLVLIRESTVLEELILDFDAMITMWSTAHLDAAVLDLPLLLIGGLDSIDVFDVRKQRVEAAFEHLRDTGCVVDWRDLQDGPCPFARVANDYIRQELSDISTPCAPRIVDLLERIDSEVLRRGRRFAGIFQLSYPEFMGGVGELETRPVASEENRLNRLLFRELNSVAQAFAFDHRCMGYALDVRRMLALWDVRLGPGSSEKDVAALAGKAREASLLAKAEYFESHPEAVATDVFVQDYYFWWLVKTRRYNELTAYAGPVVAPASLELNRGVVFLRRGRVLRAARHAIESFSISLQEPVRVLKKDKNIRALLSRADPNLRALVILFLLNHYRKYEALSVIDVPVSVNAEPAVYYKMKALVALGRSGDARALHHEYEAAIAPAHARGRRHRHLLLELAIGWYGMLLRRYAARLAQAGA
jgi:hypothetical protein